MLRDEPIEYIEEQFKDKNDILDTFGTQVYAYQLYADIFGDIDTLEVPIVIIDENLEHSKHIRTMTVSDAIEFSECRNDVLLGGSTYFNNWINKKSAKDVYAFIIDMDNTYSGVLLNALQNGWRGASGEQFAYPTYIVNSGTGLHLYFVLNEPIPNYKSATMNLDKLYRALAIQQSRRAYVTKQLQWFGQDFRMGGGLNKYGWTNTIYKVGDKWDIDELAAAVGLKNVHFTRYGEQRKKHNYNNANNKIYCKKKRKGWKSNRAFYDYALKNCTEKTKEGNRYLSMCALSCIAYKCNVDIEELEKDLLNLLPIYNKNSNRIIKSNEVKSALKMYNDRAMQTPRASLENWQGWEYKPIKRNGLKQTQHLTIARTIKQAKKTMGIMNQEGRPKGTTKQQIVEQWQQSNPTGTKAECIRATGLSKPTVYKHWNK